jgi:hypothetical protein
MLIVKSDQWIQQIDDEMDFGCGRMMGRDLEEAQFQRGQSYGMAN